jgi:hypothetical protein
MKKVEENLFQYFDFSQATTWEIPISLNLEGRKKINN